LTFGWLAGLADKLIGLPIDQMLLVDNVREKLRVNQDKSRMAVARAVHKDHEKRIGSLTPQIHFT
jgi:hypothetical protein